jgi:Fe-Mn family superoxide dismutase
VHLLPLFPPVLDRLISDLNLTKVEFLRAGVEAAQRHFGSGWLWLILERGQLMWETTSDAAQPRKAPDRKILLVVDLWEHAFLPDLAGKRADWVRFCLRATNWDVVAHRV